MSDARPKSTGIKHTTTVAFLTVVFIFSLPVLAVSHPFGTALFSLAMACMTVSVLAPSQSRQTIGTVE
jgi:hypothetical protein